VNCDGHAGDSEAIFVEIRLTPHDNRWKTEGIFLSAHCFGRSGGDCRWYRDADLLQFEWQDGVPVIWVAAGRQANYPTRTACDRGHSSIDTCDRNTLSYRFPTDDARKNIGSAQYPQGRDAGCVRPADLGSQSKLHRPDVEECIWSRDRRFRGWQGEQAGAGTTPYGRYLFDIAGFVETGQARTNP
jgi:hypothetical protein